VAFVAAQISNCFIPKTFKEAITGPDKEYWIEACKKQLAKIEKKGTWKICDLPKGHKVIPTKWVFDPKLRARLVACGNFEKKTDVETFAAVVNMTMVKIFLTVVAILNLECYQFDFEGAFLNGIMDQRSVFVRQPPGFGDGTNRVYRLLKTLYGLRDSPLVWFREATKLMRKAGFEPLASEACVFVNKDKSVWIVLYVDDMAIAAVTKDLIDSVACQLGSVFTLTPLGEVKTFLGIQLVRNRKLRTISINQEPYIDRILGRKGWTNLNGVGSPLDVHIKIHTSMEELDPSEKEEYLELVGSAQWIANNTRPDLSYAANFLGRHREKPTCQHLYQIKRVWRYLRGTKNLGLTLGGEQTLRDLDLWLHCDASWADDPATRRTTAGHIVYIGNSPIKWQSKQQDIVTLSTTEAEFINMSTAGRDMLWIKRLLRDINVPILKVPAIGTDSMNALRAAESPQENMSTRHVDVRYKWIKEKVRNGELTLNWVETQNMKADGLTKALNPTKQAHFVRMLGLTEIIHESGLESPSETHIQDPEEYSGREENYDYPEAKLSGTAA
jgi:Reverse transcriptase (RNA-dependent DNA polymerase)